VCIGTYRLPMPLIFSSVAFKSVLHAGGCYCSRS
jgi:hypothetical protein